MQIDLEEFRSAYLAEVDEHLTAAHQLLLEVEAARRAGRSFARELRELMRLLHTVKGLSSMVSVDAVVDVTHEMESVVRASDRAGGRLEEPALEALMEGLRAVEVRIAALAKGEPVAPPPAGLVARLASLASSVPSSEPTALSGDPVLNARLTASEVQQLASAAESGRRAVRVDFAPSPRMLEAGRSITTVRERVATIGDLVRVMPVASPASDQAPTGLVFALFVVTGASDEALAEIVAGEPSDVTTLTARASGAAVAQPPELDLDDDADVRRAGFLRVEVGRVDDAIEKLSAVIVTRSRLERAVSVLAAAGVDTRELDGIVLDAKRQLRDLRGSLLSVRMIPMASVLERLPLVARGLGRTNGKKVRVAIDAGTAELDKTVAERLFPALVHFVRNAVDHGIESPDARQRAGKPEEGTITIFAAAVGNRDVDIRIADDGAGIDVARVAERAGVAPPRSPGALLELLARPGLSTRAEADRASGRGMGMDIAKRTIESLGGELALETAPGVGTTFLVRVPLTIAVVDAFTVSCAGTRFAVPVPAVAEILEVSPGSLPNAPSRGADAEVKLLARRGESVALVELSAVLGLRSAADAPRARQAVLVRRSDDEVVAFGIDRVLGQQEAVVRPLADPLLAVPGISGSTDLGDGRPTLVLDLLALSSTLDGVRRPALMEAAR